METTRIGRVAVGTLVGIVLVSSWGPAADASEPRERAQAAIDWKLPHQFDEAVAEAERSKRILVIKGVSFGIDPEGAQCATKGKW